MTRHEKIRRRYFAVWSVGPDPVWVRAEPEEVEDICEQLIAAGTPKEGEPLAGGTVISFRVNLKDGSPYELVCAENASENLEKYETIWDRIECETAAAEEAELPAGD